MQLWRNTTSKKYNEYSLGALMRLINIKENEGGYEKMR